jgi:uncharacterized protein
MRVVLDTNVWLSGLLWGRVPDQVIQLVEQGQIEAIGSEEILEELQSTLQRPKLQRRLMQLEITADAVMLVVQQVTTIIRIEPLEVPGLRDPKDAIILASAVSGGASFVITGDRDLLVLREFSGIRIGSPHDFLAAR